MHRKLRDLVEWGQGPAQSFAAHWEGQAEAVRPLDVVGAAKLQAFTEAARAAGDYFAARGEGHEAPPPEAPETLPDFVAAPYQGEDEDGW